METQEIKQKIKDYFVEINEDKFTKVRTIKCKHKIEWKSTQLENKFMLTKKTHSHKLVMSIDYRHKDDIDSVYFGFVYVNTDDGYPEMSSLKMYLILDDDRTIELNQASGFNHSSQSERIGEKHMNFYSEAAQLSVSMSDFIAIANAKKIDYSIRFGKGSLENVFNNNDLFLFKGFYNASFDDTFDVDIIFENIKHSFEKKTKNDAPQLSDELKMRIQKDDEFTKKYGFVLFIGFFIGIIGGIYMSIPISSLFSTSRDNKILMFVSAVFFGIVGLILTKRFLKKFTKKKQ